jgi:hypothetical protein
LISLSMPQIELIQYLMRAGHGGGQVDHNLHKIIAQCFETSKEVVKVKM